MAFLVDATTANADQAIDATSPQEMVGEMQDEIAEVIEITDIRTTSSDLSKLAYALYTTMKKILFSFLVPN